MSRPASINHAALLGRFWQPGQRRDVLTTIAVASRTGLTPEHIRYLKSIRTGPKVFVTSPDKTSPNLYLPADVDAWLRGREAA